MSQRSAKMNRRMDAYEGRLQNLENRWDDAATYAANERYRVERRFEDLRTERRTEAEYRRKRDRVNRFLLGVLLGLSAAVLAAILFEMTIPSAEYVDKEVQPPIMAVEDINKLGTDKICSDGYLEPVFYDCALSFERQEDLRYACEESGVDMALALAVIQQETNYQNIVGDGGDSYGYMQVQPRWHKDRMDRLGVTDLMDPLSNFRVGCDYLAECLDRYPLASALSAYNSGRPDLVPYAEQVIEIYDDMWNRVI